LEQLDSEKGILSCPHVLLYFELPTDCYIDKVQCQRPLDVNKELKIACGTVNLNIITRGPRRPWNAHLRQKTFKFSFFIALCTSGNTLEVLI